MSFPFSPVPRQGRLTGRPSVRNTDPNEADSRVGATAFYGPGLDVRRDGYAKVAACGQTTNQGCRRPVHRWIGVPVRSLSTPGGVWTVPATLQCAYPVASSAGEKFPMTMASVGRFPGWPPEPEAVVTGMHGGHRHSVRGPEHIERRRLLIALSQHDGVGALRCGNARHDLPDLIDVRRPSHLGRQIRIGPGRDREHGSTGTTHRQCQQRRVDHREEDQPDRQHRPPQPPAGHPVQHRPGTGGQHRRNESGVPPSFRTADRLRSIPERRGIHGSKTAEVFAGVS
jgi:hypothetical protein